ncbi:MAG: Asp-tRNA(Asn)/Glu-tRNA(Gln) amidotransferase subunit GatC [Methanocellales archaeon]
MVITEKDIEHVAWLARIKLSEEEKREYAKQLSSILEYFKIIDQVEANVEPTFHVLGLFNVFRDDIPKESLDQNEVLAMAPKKEDGYIKGPRIVQ